VNALAPGQLLPVGRGLTIVYGNNGAGKSGYIRLLNNAFNSRGELPLQRTGDVAQEYHHRFG
jgi:DNA repair ATPase RecN